MFPRRNIGIHETAIEETPELNSFETKVDKGCFHLKTTQGNCTFHLCSWSIRNFSSFQNKESHGFPEENWFEYRLSLSLTDNLFKILIVRNKYHKCFYKSSVTGSTDFGAILFHKTLINREITDTRYNPDERAWITDENFLKLKQLPNDTLVITFKLIQSRISDAPITSLKTSVINFDYMKSLKDELKQQPSAFVKEKVKLCVGNEMEIVNKSILCARSPVFANMFEQNMQETIDNEVIFTDIKMPVLKALVSFLYSGLVEDHDLAFLFDLYYSASKYQIKELQLACFESMLSKVSIKNIFKVLNLALLHNDEIFKSAAMALISVNFKSIAGTVAWKNFMDDDPQTALTASTFFEVSNLFSK